MKIYVNLRLSDRKSLAACHWFNAHAEYIGLTMTRDENGDTYIDPADQADNPCSQAYERFFLNKYGRIISI